MNITISFHGQARQIAGSDHEIIDVKDQSSVRDAINTLSAKFGTDMQNLLLSADGALQKSVLFPVNDEVVDTDTPGMLKENDHLAIYPAMSGG